MIYPLQNEIWISNRDGSIFLYVTIAIWKVLGPGFILGWVYSDNEGVNALGTYEDKYYVELGCWLKEYAPEIHIPHDQARPSHVTEILDWHMACGHSNSSEFSETEFQEGQRLVSKLGDCLPYDGFDFRQDDAPGDVYRRFIA
jgi:hypothetical protein